jgi:hypothetical protein
MKWASGRPGGVRFLKRRATLTEDAKNNDASMNGVVNGNNGKAE